MRLCCEGVRGQRRIRPEPLTLTRPVFSTSCWGRARSAQARPGLPGRASAARRGWSSAPTWPLRSLAATRLVGERPRMDGPWAGRRGQRRWVPAGRFRQVEPSRARVNPGSVPLRMASRPARGRPRRRVGPESRRGGGVSTAGSRHGRPARTSARSREWVALPWTCRADSDHLTRDFQAEGRRPDHPTCHAAIVGPADRLSNHSRSGRSYTVFDTTKRPDHDRLSPGRGSSRFTRIDGRASSAATTSSSATSGAGPRRPRIAGSAASRASNRHGSLTSTTRGFLLGTPISASG